MIINSDSTDSIRTDILLFFLFSFTRDEEHYNKPITTVMDRILFGKDGDYV